MRRLASTELFVCFVLDQVLPAEVATVTEGGRGRPGGGGDATSGLGFNALGVLQLRAGGGLVFFAALVCRCSALRVTGSGAWRRRLRPMAGAAAGVLG
eukprot:SAG22_NODE_15235_length_353_cov_76.657480_1_plen_97_part_10